jgi:hypothetical protein
MKVDYPILFSQDGNMVCATYHNFVNLQESPAGFGETRRLAMMALQAEHPLRCQKAMWFGYGGPAGVCGEKAYGNFIGKDSPARWPQPAKHKQMWLSPQTARCPNHGGPTWEKAIEIVLSDAGRSEK